MYINPFTLKAPSVEHYSIEIHCKTQGSATKVSKPGSVAIDHRRTALMGHCPHVARRKNGVLLQVLNFHRKVICHNRVAKIIAAMNNEQIDNR